MISENFVIIGSLFNLLGSTTYVIATVQGKTRPNRVSFFIWALAPLIAFSAQISEGVGLSALMTFMVGFGPATVFVASFVNKQAFWHITALDYLCGALSLFALFLWLGASGTAAIILSIAADGLAAVPTAIKALRHPHTESPWMFVSGACGALIAILTLDAFTVADAAFPIYIFVICVALSVTIILGQRGSEQGETAESELATPVGASAG